MNIDRDLVFSFIEEDNLQRAYFRVRPLLTVHANIQEEAAKAWPDEGCLRIVPDRNEQHTFKDRMRTLGGWCVVDLRGIPAEANKIRTNKNYRPDRGEVNQYILYSDTVHPLPAGIFYDVVEGDPAAYEALAAKAITPCFYIREGDTLFGPVNKAALQKPGTAAQALGTLFPLECPDGVQRMILCIPQEQDGAVKEEEAPKAAPQPEPEPEKPVPRKEETALPIGQTLHILDEKKNHEETIQALDRPVSKGANLLHEKASRPAPFTPPQNSQPLTGTPLYRAPMRTSVPQPKNKLQEVVASQWRVARNEPLADPLPAGAQMNHVVNPVEIACQSMEKAWRVPEAHCQLTDFILSLEGMQAKLETKLMASCGNTCLHEVLQGKLQDMEAERLSVLFQLDKAKADLESFRRNALEGLRHQTITECEAMAQKKAEHEKTIALLKEQINTLTAQRDELTALVQNLHANDLPQGLAKAFAAMELTGAVSGPALHLSRVSGQHAGKDELLRRTKEALAGAQSVVPGNLGCALLGLIACCDRFGLACETPGSAATMIQNVANAMGWQKSFALREAAEQQAVLPAAPAEPTPAMLLSAVPGDTLPQAGAVKVHLTRDTAHLKGSMAYETCSWPVLTLPALPYAAVADGKAAPVSMASLQGLKTASAATEGDVDKALHQLLRKLPPLSGKAGQEMRDFVVLCAGIMDGGLAAALDWAIMLWILPMMTCKGIPADEIKPLLEEYPLSRGMI